MKYKEIVLEKLKKLYITIKDADMKVIDKTEAMKLIIEIEARVEKEDG